MLHATHEQAARAGPGVRDGIIDFGTARRGTTAGDQFPAVWKFALFVPNQVDHVALNNQLTLFKLSMEEVAGIGNPALASLSATSTPRTAR